MFKIVLSNEKLLEGLFSKNFFKKVVRGNILKMPTYRISSVVDEIYTSIRLNNRTSKESKRNRFSDIDPISLELIGEMKNPIVHDVAVSSGVTSFELFSLLKENDVPCDFVVSDKFAKYSYCKGTFATRIYDSEKQFVCGYIGPIFADQQSMWYFVGTKIAYLMLRNRNPDDATNDFLLYEQDVLKAIKMNQIQHADYDIFSKPMSQKCNYIRCMNLLNKIYFEDSMIQVGLRNLIASLEDGGILQVGRTLEGVNRVGFYRIQGGKLALVNEINGGTEISGIIEDIMK